MDDPESEWEVQESSGGNSDNGKLSLMLRLGRKLLVTGIVISSAPLVLPPLVAISAIGLVFSVPYGIFLVSYACTETVMSRLLPMPSPAAPLLLEYRKPFNGEEEANGDEDQGGQNEVIKRGISIERGEEELKKDTIEEVEMRIELVDMEQEELDKGNILLEGVYQKGGVENDEKKSMEELDEIVEENGYEKDDGEFLDEVEERPSQSFEVKIKEITELKVDQPIIEEIKSKQSADEGRGVKAVVEEDEKHSSNIELKVEGTTKGKGEQSTKESVNEQPGDEIQESVNEQPRDEIQENVNEQPRDEIHDFWTIIEGDEKERDNVNKQMTAELKNVAVHGENDELARESEGSLERNREESRSHDVAEDKQGVEKEEVDAKVKLLNGKEGKTERKQEQPLIEESLGEQPVDEVSVVLGGLEESEKKDSNLEETPLEVKIVPVQLVQAIDVEENEKLLIGARDLSERIRDERKIDCEVDDKQRAERVNVGGVGVGVGKQPKEVEVKTERTTEVKEEQYFGGESMSEQPIEEVCNIVVEFEGDEKNGRNNEKETPFQIKKVAVQSSQSTDIEEDEELVRETRGLLEKIRDEGKTNYAVDDKRTTEKEHVGTEEDDKKIVGDVEKAKTRCIIAHDVMGKTTREFDPKVEENKADNKVQMKESVENLDAFSKETKLVKDAETSEEMDVDNIPRRAQPVGPGSETVNDGSSRKELAVESAIFLEGVQAEDDNENNVDQNYLLNKEKKDAIFSDEDEREINDEQGLDLLEDLSTVSQQGSASDVNTFEESQPSSSHSVHQEISDHSELLVSIKVRISAENAIDTASNEALYSEEKIWEQINALRTIIGYKAARQETYIEELKALYLFTGIEPPADFKNNCDLVEVNAKLRILMSVVGVK